MSKRDDRQHAIVRRIMKWTSPIHRTIYRASKGRIGSTWATGRQPILLLTTTGRKTGKPRTNPACYLEQDGGLILVASHAGVPQHPSWYLNLKDNPEVTVERNGQRTRMHAKVTEGEERKRLWSIVSSKYPMYLDYQEGIDRQLPVVFLTSSPG